MYHRDYARCPNDGAEVTLSATDPLIGAQVDRYVIDELIGEGGMGRVYIARHTRLTNKRFAVKVLLGDAAISAAMRTRFAREAESTSRLAHPNIVSVIDYGETSTGLPYLVMELVDGAPLDMFTTEPMEPARVVRLARGICAGLAYAHGEGVIHRDLKPENILIATGPNGEEIPRIVDFGLAITRDAERRLTSTGMAMGTIAYGAPEQLAGMRVDQRADLYSLGMTMYELLTGGKLPFEDCGMAAAGVRAHVDTPPFAMVAPGVEIAPGLEALVMKLVARRRVDRFNDAVEVIEALDALEHVTGEHATPALRIPRRKRAPWLVVGAGLAASVALAWTIRTAQHAAPAGASAVLVSSQIEPEAVWLSPPRAVAHERVTPVVISAEAPVVRAKPHRLAKRRPRSNAIAPAAPALAPAPALVPPPPPLVLHAAIEGIDVRGPLPAAEVRRAALRLLPALDRCRPAAPETVVVTLEIDEARRARRVQATSGSASSCVCAVLSAMRTESAPDTGDVRVDIRIAYGAGT